jgi:hypothetical protein
MKKQFLLFAFLGFLANCSTLKGDRSVATAESSGRDSNSADDFKQRPIAGEIYGCQGERVKDGFPQKTIVFRTGPELRAYQFPESFHKAVVYTAYTSRFGYGQHMSRLDAEGTTVDPGAESEHWQMDVPETSQWVGRGNYIGFYLTENSKGKMEARLTTADTKDLNHNHVLTECSTNVKEVAGWIESIPAWRPFSPKIRH